MAIFLLASSTYPCTVQATTVQLCMCSPQGVLEGVYKETEVGGQISFSTRDQTHLSVNEAKVLDVDEISSSVLGGRRDLLHNLNLILKKAEEKNLYFFVGPPDLRTSLSLDKTSMTGHKG